MASKRRKKHRPAPGGATGVRPKSVPASSGGRGPAGLVLVRVLLAVALATGLFLAWFSLRGGAVPGCGPESGCDEVLQSRWAYWLGVPVSLPAAAAYATLLGATFLLGPGRGLERRRRAWMVAVPLAVMIVLAAVWFVGLQAVVVRRFCRFCLVAHATGLLGSILLLRQAPLSNQGRRPAGNEPLLSTRSFVRMAVVGAAGLAVLVAGQVLISPNRSEVHAMGGSERDAAGPQPREFSLYDGKFVFDLREAPVLGSPDATHVIASLFDYTCHHCRDMHKVLEEAHRPLSNRLAILALPVPLDTNCNHVISRTPSAHQNACEYARLGLAVWRADRSAFAHFDSWLFDPPSPLPVSEVRAYAEKLVGKEKLDAALASEWVREHLATSIAVYGENLRRTRRGAIPQLIIGKFLRLGPLRTPDELYALLEQHLGMARP